jgi:hypothetical protein
MRMKKKIKKLDAHFPIKVIAFYELPLSRLPAVSLLRRIHRFPIDKRDGMALDTKE